MAGVVSEATPEDMSVGERIISLIWAVVSMRERYLHALLPVDTYSRKEG